MIGIFVILSLVLFMTAVVILGSAKFFAKENFVITYFEGSLQGLDVGAPVTYRGVTIGQVKEIKIHIQSNGKQSQELIIPVLIALNAGDTLVVNSSGIRDDTNVNDFLKSMCDQGLRAKLKLQSMVTGKRYVDLAFYENSTAVFRDQAEKYFEIPTLPSEMHQLSRLFENINLEDIYHKAFNALDSLDKLTAGLANSLNDPKTLQLADNLSTAAASLNSILSQVDADVSPILKKVDSGLNNFNVLASHADQMVTSLDTQINPFMNHMVTTLTHIDTTLKQADGLLAQAEKTIKPNSPLYYRVSEAMGQLEKTARSVEKLSEFIYRNPDAFIFGLQKKGEPSEEQ